MSNAVADEAASGFVGAFYQALAYGKDLQTAFELGIAQLRLKGASGDEAPRLLSRHPNLKDLRFD